MIRNSVCISLDDILTELLTPRPKDRSNFASIVLIRSPSQRPCGPRPQPKQVANFPEGPVFEEMAVALHKATGDRCHE